MPHSRRPSQRAACSLRSGCARSGRVFFSHRSRRRPGLSTAGLLRLCRRRPGCSALAFDAGPAPAGLRRRPGRRCLSGRPRRASHGAGGPRRRVASRNKLGRPKALGLISRRFPLCFRYVPGLRISPKKLNAVAQLTRGLSVEQALAQCELLPKKAARLVLVALRSAAANATHNHGLAAERLVVQKAFVGKGRFLKRIKFHARGKTGVMHHGVSRLTIILEERPLGLRLSKRTARPAEGRASQAPRSAQQGEAALVAGEGAAAAPEAAPEFTPLLPSWMRHRRRRLAKRARAAAGDAAKPRAAAKM
jgi:ribosomal protein L22